MAVAIRDHRETKITVEHPALSTLRQPLIEGEKSYGEVTTDICKLLDNKPGVGWWIAFSVAVSLLIAGAIATTYTVTTGIGTWHLQQESWDNIRIPLWLGAGPGAITHLAGELVPAPRNRVR